MIQITKNLIKAIKDTIYHDGIEHSGYISFLLMLSIFPFLVFFVASIGFIGSSNLGTTLIDIVLKSDWAQFIDALKPRIIEITSSPPQHMLTIAIVSCIWTASSIFEALRTVLNKAYRIKTPPSYLFRRFISVIEFIIAIIITIIVMFVLLFIPNLILIFDINISNIIPIFKKAEVYYNNIVLLITILFTFMIITMLYYFLPSRKQKLTKTLPGVVLVLVSWSSFSVIFKYYLTTVPAINIIYGSIAGIIVALLYFYICSLIFIIGAEFNYQMERSTK